MIRENQRFFNQMNVLSDALIIILSMLPAFWIRFHLLSGGVATEIGRAHV